MPFVPRILVTLLLSFLLGVLPIAQAALAGFEVIDSNVEEQKEPLAAVGRQRNALSHARVHVVPANVHAARSAESSVHSTTDNSLHTVTVPRHLLLCVWRE